MSQRTFKVKLIEVEHEVVRNDKEWGKDECRLVHIASDRQVCR